MVDTNGKLNIQSIGIAIGPDYTLDEFKSNPHFKDFNFWGQNDGYQRYGAKEVLIDNLSFSLLVIFYKSKISQVNISLSNPKVFQGMKVEEHKRLIDLDKRKHDELIRRHHGATSIKYHWGSITSVLDDRFQYTARICIQYNNSHLTDPAFVKSTPKT